MKEKTATTFNEFNDFITAIPVPDNPVTLFRGQSIRDALLPSAVRKNPKFDSTEVEKKMLEDFKRHSLILVNRPFANDWELLIYAQHFGLKTRLLDWTSNPLSALWFACSNEYKMKEDAFVYCLSAKEDMLLDVKKDKSPFENPHTKILHPMYNNERIVAQAGWFTAHKFSTTYKQFVDLKSDRALGTDITEITIPASLKEEMLNRLSLFGINNKTVFPDISGLCKHLNWVYRDQV